MERIRIAPMAQRVLFILIAAMCCVPSPFASAAQPHGRVLIVVMDGLRRDSITEEGMPTLHKLARNGVMFDAHHPVFLSTTEVNGTALATGMRPASSGVMANREYRPDVDLLRPVDTQGQWATWKGDGQQPWIAARTLPELARAAGLKTAVAGTKGVALMWDRGMRSPAPGQATLFEGKAIPSALLDQVIPEIGPMPAGVDWKHFANEDQDRWTTRVLIEKLWAQDVPQLSVLWLSEPDFSQHGTGVGSPQCAIGLKSSDDCLASALAALEQKKLLDKTNVFVVSDHGFSTINRRIDVADLLRKAGFKADTSFKKPPEPGRVLVVGLGGVMSFYVTGNDAPTREKLVAFLQKSDFAGVIFTRDGDPGTFRFSEGGIDTQRPPDVVVAFRWKDEAPRGRSPGTVIADGMDAGQGIHGSLSRYDLRNTLVASGPSIRSGMVNKLPSSNSDLAPTVVKLLGITLPQGGQMDGRVLTEALVDETAEEAKPPETQTLRAGNGLWRQYLKVTSFAGRRYFDEGNQGDGR